MNWDTSARMRDSRLMIPTTVSAMPMSIGEQLSRAWAKKRTPSRPLRAPAGFDPQGLSTIDAGYAHGDA
ncbi:hypothetical protein PHISCL_11168 [Aspergillus sclerotialis]|uniref:Uncharacterized protein n=1 Tax=Aspergillus sclerotialis TaxID=2070753 RepID=A0A3A2ZEU8_9EURO|nr:hypothetical protein PHISCL_11168 [Aspergillus sclerotialis]